MQVTETNSQDISYGGQSPSTQSVEGKSADYRFFKGWRVGAFIGAISCSIVFSINLGTLLYVNCTKKGGTLYEGDCDVAKRSSLISHVLINGLSTILLASSNYSAQILTAPTRAHIDAAHVRGHTLVIGALSMSNLWSLGKGRLVLWIALVMSSLPLHLLYNSGVYLQLATNAYTAAPISENRVPEIMAKAVELREMLVRLENSECIKTYTEQFITQYSDLYIILPSNTSDYLYRTGVVYGDRTGLDLNDENEYIPYDWICQKWTELSFGFHRRHCNSSFLRDNSANWKYGEQPVQYCLAQKVEPSCKLQFNTTIMLIVTTVNLFKAFSIIAVLAFYRTSNPLITIGDAIASFLRCPDETTKRMCLIDFSSTKYSQTVVEPITFTLKPERWMTASRKSRWAFTFIVSSIGLGVSSFYLYKGVSRINGFGYHITDLKFGAVDTRAMASINYPRPRYLARFLVVALLANTPQIILSLCYLMFNAILTSMVTAYEWDNYSLQYKPLRVTDPKGQQRSTYFLQLPYRYGIPLMIGSFILHWLFSQSIFSVNIATFRDGHETQNYEVNQIGYSPIGIVCSITAAILILVSSLVIGYFRKLRGVIPLFRGDSATISAACHPPKTDTHAAWFPVRWGCVGMCEEMGGEIEHCSFSSCGGIIQPVEGKLYA